VKMHDAARAAFNQREDMKKIAIAALLCSFIATPVLAENLSPVYVEAGLGVASYEFQTSPRDVRIAAGLQFSPVWAVEVGGAYLGDSSGLGIKPTKIVSVRTLQAALVGSYRVNNDFDWVAKLGVSRNQAKETGNGAIAKVTDLYWALGGDYHVNHHFSVRGLYENFGAIGRRAIDLQAVNASAISVNLHYNF
ncbi:MAG: outer membrane beta-barrel protein, partial [Sideroxydans sp.]|nr:outer membrane beta-barrel protein [Sideroxydans sp.]